MTAPGFLSLGQALALVALFLVACSVSGWRQAMDPGGYRDRLIERNARTGKRRLAPDKQAHGFLGFLLGAVAYAALRDADAVAVVLVVATVGWELVESVRPWPLAPYPDGLARVKGQRLGKFSTLDVSVGCAGGSAGTLLALGVFLVVAGRP